MKEAAFPEVATEARPAGPGLHLVRGRTMRSALIDARRSFGAKSLVVDQVTDVDPRTGRGRVTLAVSTTIPRSTDALKELRVQAAELLASRDRAQSPTDRGAPSAGAHAPPGAASPLADIERRLRENGASKALREQVLEGVAAATASNVHPLDLAAEEIGRAFAVASMPFQSGETAVLAFLGTTGVGKTTTLVKVAARLARAGRRVALATLDLGRVGASAQVATYAKRIGVPVLSIEEPAQFAAVVESNDAGAFDVVLVDGSGDVAGDVRTMVEIRDAIAHPRVRVASIATLSAGNSVQSHAAVTNVIGQVDPIGVAITKIDEASEALPAMEHAAARGLGVAFFTNGTDLGKHLVRASGERFADLALIGRIG